MNVRFATKYDREEIFALLNELIEEVNLKSGQSIKPPQAYSGRGKIYDELLARPDVKIFVAEENDKLLGVADLFILPLVRRGYYQGHLEDLVVTKSSRGQGVGTALLEAAKEYCRKNGIKVIKLNSAMEWESSHRFYEKRGGRFTEKMFRFDL